jgi:hypothetical protein
MNPTRENFRSLDASAILSWVHFGDLHLTTEHEQNYRDLLALISEANTYLARWEGVNFALLPGDNADNGSEGQYRLLRRALDDLRLPIHALPGDHDIQSDEAPARSRLDHENQIGARPDKGLLGTQLGPNKNGHPW